MPYQRVFGSSRIPPHMYRALHIMSAKQAARRLPSLVPIPTSAHSALMGISAVGAATSSGLLETADALTPAQMVQALARMSAANAILGAGSCFMLRCWSNPNIATVAYTSGPTGLPGHE
jgi:hypothetical protein